MAQFTAETFAFAPAPVPEPATILLLGSALALMTAYVRANAGPGARTPDPVGGRGVAGDAARKNRHRLGGAHEDLRRHGREGYPQAPM